MLKSRKLSDEQSFIGVQAEYYAQILFVAFAIISAALFVLQLRYLKKYKILPVYFIPLLSFCICYENSILYYGDKLSPSSNIAHAGKVFHSLEIPLFILFLFEVTFRLHEVRLAHFCCIPFDQGENVTFIPATLLLWAVRLLAVGLFIMNLFVDFQSVQDFHPVKHVGSAGYIYLSRHSTSLALWLSLIPPIILSAIALQISFVCHRYGQNLTFALNNPRRWSLITFGALGQAIGQIFDAKVYAVTSNAGELSLLIAATYLMQLVQEDLALAGNFANYLHHSNVEFEVKIGSPRGSTNDGIVNAYNTISESVEKINVESSLHNEDNESRTNVIESKSTTVVRFADDSTNL